jgi:hypothetical protein
LGVNLPWQVCAPTFAGSFSAELRELSAGTADPLPVVIGLFAAAHPLITLAKPRCHWDTQQRGSRPRARRRNSTLPPLHRPAMALAVAHALASLVADVCEMDGSIAVGADLEHRLEVLTNQLEASLASSPGAETIAALDR